MNTRTVIIGTRGSQLATTQSSHIQQAIIAAGHTAELHIVRTPGDDSQQANTPIAQVGVGVFTETLRAALTAGQCDIAVHSFKDLPTTPRTDLRTIVPRRADAREVLISRDNIPLAKLPPGSHIGTSAPRRIAQLAALRPDLIICPIRGNIDTRISRVGQDLDAIILARAGVERLGQLHRVAETIDPTRIMPAPAQGALSVEVRADDPYAWQAVAHIDHLPSHIAALAERSVLRTLEAGCTAPIAAYSHWQGMRLELTVTVFSPDGCYSMAETCTTVYDWDTHQPDILKQQACDVGRRIGQTLIGRGAQHLITGQANP